MPRVSNHEIEFMLVAGTCNIKETTAQWLDDQVNSSQPELIIYPKESFGWFIPVPPDAEILNDWETVPSELGMIITYAMGKGCSWVMFDRDAPAIKELPTFDW